MVARRSLIFDRPVYKPALRVEVVDSKGVYLLLPYSVAWSQTGRSPYVDSP